MFVEKSREARRKCNVNLSKSQGKFIGKPREACRQVKASLSGFLTITGDNFGNSTDMRINVIDLEVDDVRPCAKFQRDGYETLVCKLKPQGVGV